MITAHMANTKAAIGMVQTINGSAIVGDFKVNPPTSNDRQNIKVAVRLRPLIDDAEKSKEKGKKNQDRRAWKIEQAGALFTLIQKGHARKVEGRTVFSGFFQVFDEESKTPLLYKSLVRPMVKAVLSGRHATVFAYGTMGSGKTFTMQGDPTTKKGQAGIIQLAASDVFRFMKQDQSRQFSVKVSYFEICNEHIRDLLSDPDVDAESIASQEGSDPASPYRSLFSSSYLSNAGGEVMFDVRQVYVETVDEILELLMYGNKLLMQSPTDSNARSTLSHSCFRLSIESRNVNGSQGMVHYTTTPEVGRRSDFNFVDLAGSEKVNASNNSSSQQQREEVVQEGATINKSLLALTKDSVVPPLLLPRDGNAEIAIVCCASPSKAFVEESRSTLKFASRAKDVLLSPRVNEVELGETRSQLGDMKQQQLESSEYDHMNDDTHRMSGIESQGLPELAQQRGYVMPSRNFNGDQDFSLSDDEKRGETLPKHHESMVSMDVDDVFISNSKLSDASDTQPEPLNNSESAGFKLEHVDERAATETLQRYLAGDMQSADSADFFHLSESITMDSTELEGLKSQVALQMYSGPSTPSIPSPPRKEFRMPGAFGVLFDSPNNRNDVTTKTEDESFDGPGASHASVSLKIASDTSLPTSISDADVSSLGRRGEASSWDTMDLNTSRKVQVGQPRRTLQRQIKRDGRVPREVTIIGASSEFMGSGDTCLIQKLQDSQNRILFLERKLEAADDLIESTFRDLEHARLCIQDLAQRNVEITVKLKEKRREDTKEAYEAGEVVVEQYWLLKGSIYVSLFFFFCGGHEFFMACVFFVWLALETKMTT